MKVLIVTINDGRVYNFGNKLQNFAVSYILEKFGIQSETLDFESQDKFVIKHEIKKILMKLFNYKLAKSEERKFYWQYEQKRIENFKKFDHKYLKQHIDYELTNSNDYDYYIVGSDQVWNPEFFKYHKMKQYAFLLSFCQDSKKICLSPSFGVSEISDEWKPWFKKYISLIPRVSVREEAGAKIIKELTGKEAKVLIDPTLMLDSQDWNKVAIKPKNIDVSKPYLLTYFLGEKSDRVNNDVKKYADEYGLKIYNLLDKTQKDLYSAGPSEFIYLFANAKLIMTDSFHACVFSFLYQKPFVVYAREWDGNNMMSRLDTLLEKFDLKRKYANSGLKNELMECNYENGYKVLKEERSKFIDYLREALDENREN